MSDPAKGLGIYVSLTAIFINIIEKIKKEKLSHPLAGKEVLEFDEVKLLFLSGDETVCSVVKLTAKKLALHFLNINYLLDITHVVLDGRIVELGEKFLEYVRGQSSVFRSHESRDNAGQHQQRRGFPDR